MPHKDDNIVDFAILSGQILRQKAEEILRHKSAQSPKMSEAAQGKDLQEILHELQIHQIELEMQNAQMHMTMERVEISRARYFDLYDLAPVGYLTMNEKGLIQESNLTAASLLGMARSALVNLPIYRFIFKDDQDIYYLHRNRLFKTREPQEYELRMVRPDGAPFWAHLATTITPSETGGSVCRIVMTDITPHKRAEEDKERLQAQLFQAQKIDSIGRLAGGIAHEFNNMLNIILGHSELAMDQMDPSMPLHSDLQEIRKAAERSADLTRQLLAFARKQTVAPRVLDINATVSGMLNMMQRLIGENVELVWQPDSQVWPVKMDPSQIDQILANLCINGRDAITGVGKIVIETKNAFYDESWCAKHPDFMPGEFVLLSVSDNGCGMSPDTLGQIYDPFFTTKAMGKGMGMGLPTVNGIVKQNSGFITTVSALGKGTTFHIYLPRHDIPKPSHAPQIEVVKPAPQGSETILLVEDEPAILNLTTMMLERQGYNVLAVERPSEAIRLARVHASEIQLLITDVIMPEMNGKDLARNIQSLFPHIKHLFMSGYTADVITHHGLLAEDVNFIQKPFTMKELGAKIREALGHDEGKPS